MIDIEKFFSYDAERLKSSEIRDLLKLVDNPNTISMAGGLPNSDSFPIDKIKEISDYVLDNYGGNALQYGTTKGYTKLIDGLSKYMKDRYSVNCNQENILITTGSQQALDLIGRIFIDPGDTFIVEGPTYLAALQAFRFYHPRFTQIPMDESGIMTDILEEKLSTMNEKEKIKILYTIPTFQNPKGVTMTKERRKQLIHLASEYDFLIVEDNPYSELRYFGKDVLPIKSLDKENRVIYLGTFSKILSPGFRVGWVVADEKTIKKMEIAKQSIDLCTNVMSQYIAAEFLRTYMKKHIEKIRDLYRPKLELFLDTLEKYMPENVSWTKPEGGMFIWLSIENNIDTKKMLDYALKKGVAYVPGESFFVNRDVKNSMRLNFTYPTDDQIKEGIKRLSNIIRTYRKI